jgi:uracil-DNA glycosylase
MNPYWKDRGSPWEYDPGPPENRRWAELFAQTPNCRGLGKSNLGKEVFRWHFGPVFYRGRLEDHAVKVLVVGQDGAQDESLAHRSFTGGTGSRMQYFLNYIGITESYLFLNTFIYPIVGQYTEGMASLAQDLQAPVAKHRHDIFNYVLDLNDVHLVIAVGNAAKESIVTWVRSRGGSCSQGAANVSLCTSAALGPRTKIVGVMHPGAAGQGGSAGAILADFKKALAKIKAWMDADTAWLPPDATGSRKFDQPYKYRSAPIPFRDYPYGTPIRLGRGGTSSNRKDGQRSIQIYSAGGMYNASGVKLKYSDPGEGSQEGYSEDPGDVPYEPPKTNFT